VHHIEVIVRADSAFCGGGEPSSTVPSDLVSDTSLQCEDKNATNSIVRTTHQRRVTEVDGIVALIYKVIRARVVLYYLSASHWDIPVAIYSNMRSKWERKPKYPLCWLRIAVALLQSLGSGL